MLGVSRFFSYLCRRITKIRTKNGRLPGESLQFVRQGVAGKTANPLAAKLF